MEDVIFALADILAYMKDFNSGYMSDVNDKMLIDYEGKRFLVSFKEIENPDIDMYLDMKKYME